MHIMPKYYKLDLNVFSAIDSSIDRFWKTWHVAILESIAKKIRRVCKVRTHHFSLTGITLHPLRTCNIKIWLWHVVCNMYKSGVPNRTNYCSLQLKALILPILPKLLYTL